MKLMITAAVAAILACGATAQELEFGEFYDCAQTGGYFIPLTEQGLNEAPGLMGARNDLVVKLKQCSYWELGDDPKEVITGNCDADVETMESLYVKSGRGFTYFHGYPGEYGSRSFGQIVTDGLKLTHSEIDEVRSSRYGEVSAAVIKTYACTKRPPK